MNNKSIMKIEVCQGRDCFGSGGGAVLLEMEDLAASSSSCISTSCQPHRLVVVVEGACRNFCTMGPNVHYHYNSEQHQHQHHFTNVQSVQQCRDVLLHVQQQEQQPQHLLKNLKANNANDNVGDDNDDDDDAIVGNGSSSSSIMMQRAEKKRWTFLRQVARAKKVAAATTSSSQQHRLSGMINNLETELEHVIAAELSACCSSSQKDNTNNKAAAMERVANRKVRYQGILKGLMTSPPTEAISNTDIR